MLQGVELMLQDLVQVLQALQHKIPLREKKNLSQEEEKLTRGQLNPRHLLYLKYRRYIYIK